LGSAPYLHTSYCVQLKNLQYNMLYIIAISRNLMVVVSGIEPNSIGFTNLHVHVEPVQVQPEEV